jgi:hypothetical protein
MMSMTEDEKKLFQYDMIAVILHKDKYDDPSYKACADIFERVSWVMAKYAGAKIVAETLGA